MTNLKFLQKFYKKHSDYRSKRHELIKQSADILRQSKQAIFALHRHNNKDAEKAIQSAEKAIESLQQSFQKEPQLREEGSFHAAIEEYIEAKLFFDYLTTKKIKPISVIQPSFDEYFGGLCDFTGELVRQAVLSATSGDYESIQAHSKTTSDIIELLITFDLSGKIRNKFDQAKRNLKRLEEICYDIQIRNKQ